MKQYTITLNEHQLNLIADCIEDCHRFLAGEVDMHNTTFHLPLCREVRDILRCTYPKVVPELWDKHHCLGASYGWDGDECADKHQQRRIAETYYLYREMRHRIAKENNADDWNVYASPTLTCPLSGEPITIEVTTKQ